MLGIIISDSSFLMKLYSLTIVVNSDETQQWKIAQTCIFEADLTNDSLAQLIHVLALDGWNSVHLLCSRRMQVPP